MQDRIKQTFSAFREARCNLYDASEKELEAKEYLKITECMLLLSDKITGKNAEIREAQMRDETLPDRKNLEAVRQEKAKAQLAFDLASMEVDELKWIIRATNGKVE